MAPSIPPLRSAIDRTNSKPSPEREPLWRHVLGECLRGLRHERGEKLSETARRAGVSPQYLSEMERGVKEPSSEMIAAVAERAGCDPGRSDPRRCRELAVCSEQHVERCYLLGGLCSGRVAWLARVIHRPKNAPR
ncbi:helix-turn-helix domain-containing protein [Nonomuraea ferruginea]